MWTLKQWKQHPTHRKRDQICDYWRWVWSEGEEEMEEVVKRYKLPAKRWISSKDLMYSMVIVVNNKVFSGLSWACVLPGSEGGCFDSPFHVHCFLNALIFKSITLASPGLWWSTVCLTCTLSLQVSAGAVSLELSQEASTAFPAWDLSEVKQTLVLQEAPSQVGMFQASLLCFLHFKGENWGPGCHLLQTNTRLSWWGDEASTSENGPKSHTFIMWLFLDWVFTRLV